MPQCWNSKVTCTIITPIQGSKYQQSEKAKTKFPGSTVVSYCMWHNSFIFSVHFICGYTTSRACFSPFPVTINKTYTHGGEVQLTSSGPLRTVWHWLSSLLIHSRKENLALGNVKRRHYQKQNKTTQLAGHKICWWIIMCRAWVSSLGDAGSVAQNILCPEFYTLAHEEFIFILSK